MKLLSYPLRAYTGCLFVMGCLLAVTIFSSASVGTANAASKPKTVAEIALYQGADRQEMLIAGAKQEGKLAYYNVNSWLTNVVSKEFEKKYPFIKVLSWRDEAVNVLKRVTEEYKASRFLVDAIAVSPPTTTILRKEGIFQEFYSPEATYYEDHLKLKGKTGFYYIVDLETYIVLGFNTNMVSLSEAPKSLKDLLNPKWKDRMSIVGSSTGLRWIGNALEVMGRDYMEQLSRQNIKVQNVSGGAMANLIASGEVPLSPTVYDSNIFVTARKGGPVRWLPLEPVVVTAIYSGLSSKAPNPHSAMLFLDYIHSQEGQKAVMQGGFGSSREDIESSVKKFKKTYPETKYSLEEYDKKYSEWQNLMTRLFIKK